MVLLAFLLYSTWTHLKFVNQHGAPRHEEQLEILRNRYGSCVHESSITTKTTQAVQNLHNDGMAHLFKLEKEMKSPGRDVRELETKFSEPRWPNPKKRKKYRRSREKEIQSGRKADELQNHGPDKRNESDLDTARGESISKLGYDLARIHTFLLEAVEDGEHGIIADAADEAMQRACNLHLESIYSLMSSQDDETWNSPISVDEESNHQTKFLTESELEEEIQQIEAPEIEIASPEGEICSWTMDDEGNPIPQDRIFASEAGEEEIGDGIVSHQQVVDDLHNHSSKLARLVLMFNKRRQHWPIVEMPGETGNFSFETLRTATNHFAEHNLVGAGGSSQVFKGILGDGSRIIVKCVDFSTSSFAMQGFENEIRLLSACDHSNVVKLQGYCLPRKNTNVLYRKPKKYSGGSHGFLVMEYVEGGAVNAWLLGNRETLDWSIRINIVTSIARAVSFFHNQRPAIVHRDIKPSNVLLDASFHAKLADFGLAIALDSSGRATDSVRGTIGYIAPEYLLSEIVTSKVDVYAYGVTMLYIVSGQKAFDLSRLGDDEFRNVMLVDWVRERLDQDRFEEIIDSRIHGWSFNELEARMVVEIAMSCTNSNPEERPTMDQVLENLRTIDGKYSSVMR